MSFAPPAGFAAIAITGLPASVVFPRRNARVPLLIVLTVFVVGFAKARSPVTSPLQDLEIQRSLLAGSDALLERMVIPPNRPDWLLTDCGQTSSEARHLMTTGTSYDRMRHALCEVASKSNLAVRN